MAAKHLLVAASLLSADELQTFIPRTLVTCANDF